MSALGTKLRVAARYVEPGDFTTRSGFRQAVRVEPVTITRGRGSKRRTFVLDVRITRVDGSVELVPVDEPTTVYRRSVAA